MCDDYDVCVRVCVRAYVRACVRVCMYSFRHIGTPIGIVYVV